jgi:hypothetical protein
VVGYHGLTPRGAHGGWKTGLRPEVALDGFDLVISKAQVLHIAKALAVLGPAHVHHKRLVAMSKYAPQVKPLDKINL